MNPAGKLDMILELYTAGCLCDCRRQERVWDEEDERYVYEVLHRKLCKGRLVIMDMLQEEASGQV